MSENNNNGLVEKKVGELVKEEFLVPAYQRGYRWTEVEVAQLIEDIYALAGTQNEYCLQPLIVKYDKVNKRYDVIDGQQRLTTLYIILKYCAAAYVAPQPLFSLSYETRPNSKKFLEGLNAGVKDNLDDYDIDCFHIAQAYVTVDEKMGEIAENDYGGIEHIDSLKTYLHSYIVKNVSFIWYELGENDIPETFFRKVNLGKIQLTDSELIRALMLKEDNFEGDQKEEQGRIARFLDRTEQGLREESFWGFIKGGETSAPRIELLFRLLAYAENKELSKNETIPKNADHFTFLVFNKRLEKCTDKAEKAKYIKKIRDDIEISYDRLRNWYDDHEYYHLAGFIAAVGGEKALNDVYEAISSMNSKSEIKKCIYEKVLNNSKLYIEKGGIDKLKEDIQANDKAQLCADIKQILDKLEKGLHDDKIRTILLLFNIASCICESNKQYRFPFDIYKKTGHDIEHINAKANDPEPDNSIGNLTLLPAELNRNDEYKTAEFKKKRKMFVEYIQKGKFAPLCTHNVFLQTYTVQTEAEKSDDEWGNDDIDNYTDKIASVLSEFFYNGYKGKDNLAE